MAVEGESGPDPAVCIAISPLRRFLNPPGGIVISDSVNNCSDWRKSNGLKDDRQAIALRREPRVLRVVRKKLPPGVLVISPRLEYGLSAKEHLNFPCRNGFQDPIDRAGHVVSANRLN